MGGTGAFMNIEHLREFIYLAKTLSFSVTARQFYVSQSVLSKHIASMEGELGVKLFLRDSHHVRLSQSGKAFFEEACALVGGYDRAIARIVAINQSFESVVRVGYLRNAARPFLAMFLKRMQRDCPLVRVNLFCMEYGELLSALNARKVDLAMTIDVDADMRMRCDSAVIYEDRFDAIAGYDHPLAALREKGISTEDLCECQLLLPDPSTYSGMSDFISSLLPTQCTSLARRYYSDVDTMYLDVEMGEHVAFSSEHNIPVFGDKVCFLQIKDKPTSYNVSALWLKDANGDVVAPCLEALDYCKSRLWSKKKEHVDAK